MNKKTIITALLALVAMMGYVNGSVWGRFTAGTVHSLLNIHKIAYG